MRRRLVALLVGSAVALALGEGILRIPFVARLAEGGEDLFWTRKWGPEVVGAFTLDPEMGFRPVPGKGMTSTWGTLLGPGEPADGAVKRPGVERLLFVGDSVTRRGRIIRSLRRLYGDERFEWWNAGVESFATAQEVAFYERFNAPLRPDHVILTFHPNDFQATPVAFIDPGGRLSVYAPALPLSAFSRSLFLQSRLFRLAIAALSSAGRGREATRQEVESSLARLASRTRNDGARLTVLVLPPLKPESTWSAREREDRAFILGALERLRIRTFDLHDGLEELFRNGVPVQEVPGDAWHPADGAAEEMAKRLKLAGLLDAPGPAL